jgi:hypothetical protein
MLVESWQEDEFENGKKDAELESERQPSFSALGSLDEGAHSELPRVPNSHDKFDKHYQPSKSILAFCLQGICGATLAAAEQNPPVHLLAHAVLFREASQMHEGRLVLDESGIASSVLAGLEEASNPRPTP